MLVNNDDEWKLQNFKTSKLQNFQTSKLQNFKDFGVLYEDEMDSSYGFISYS